MIKFKDLKEAGGAGDWGTDKARKKLQQDTPGQGITDMGVKNKERKESVELSEKLKVSDGLGAWIDDFMKSDAPQFKNADDKKRRDMAIAAFTSAGGKLDESVISIEEGAVALSTVEKEIRSNGGKIVKKDDRSITFTLNGAQRKVPVDRGHVLDTYYMQLQKMFEEVEYVSEDGQWGVKNVYLKYTPDVLKLKKIKIQDTISNLKRQHSSLNALGGKNPRAEEIKELEGKLRMIDQAMRTKKESLDLDEADTYAIYKKGKVFDTFRSKEDAHDSLDSMGLSAISKKDYSVRKLPANYKSNWSMKEEVDLDESLPPHLRKIIGKGGNIDPKKVAKHVHGGQKTSTGAKVSDVTPKGYGPREEVELDEGTLAASDGSVVDALLTAVKQKLMKDLSSGNVDDANEIAKMVKMTIEKDYKRKGFSRLKR